jgi:hemerythrin superfamily protein
MDAIEMLVEQHRLVEKLFDRLAEIDDDDGRRAIEAARICDVLAVHCAIEEAHFYPAVRERRTEDMLLESLEEHLQIKRLMADLVEMEPTGGELEAKLRVLEEEIEHHFGEEERELFPRVRKLLSEDELEGIASDMAELEAEIEEQGEPRFRVLSEIEAPTI